MLLGEKFIVGDEREAADAGRGQVNQTGGGRGIGCAHGNIANSRDRCCRPTDDEKRHVVFRSGVGDGEADRDLIEKSAFSEIVADKKTISKFPVRFSLGDSKGFSVRPSELVVALCRSCRGSSDHSSIFISPAGRPFGVEDVSGQAHVTRSRSLSSAMLQISPSAVSIS